MADRDIFEEMVRAGAVAMWGSTERDATKIARMVLSAALAGRQVVDLPAEPVDQLAARVLDDHLLTGPLTGQCRCGWGDGSDTRTLGRSHSAHVVEQLGAAGALAGSGSGED